MEIRLFKDADIPDISRLYYNTIHRINSRDYSPDQIKAWAPRIYNISYWSERFRSRQVWVVEDSNGILGFVETEKTGHIDCFYVHHLFQGRGIGSALMNHVIEVLQSRNVHRAFAEVSITARPFFEKMGFTVKEERDVEYNNERLKLYLMEKYI